MNHFLKTPEAIKIFENMQKLGSVEMVFPDDLDPDDNTYLHAEKFIRDAQYHKVKLTLHKDCSLWMKNLVTCMVNLFTSPNIALTDLKSLEGKDNSKEVAYRLKVWRMHLNLLLGYEVEGLRLRYEIEETSVPDYLWKIESETLLALSYFSSGQCKISVERHTKLSSQLKEKPELFFKTFGFSMALRASLKICDAQSFEFFSKELEGVFGSHPDLRYELRMHGYRAMILTQLGEINTAKRYWTEGDKILPIVEGGEYTLERAQYLMFRCLASAMLGDFREETHFYELAKIELEQSGVYAIHQAELEICHLLSHIANPVLRAKNIERSYQEIKRVITVFSNYIENSDLLSVKECYKEALHFCQTLLIGEGLSVEVHEKDKWKTLTLSIIDNFQNTASFAERIDYFRLIPKFVDELEKTTLTERGIGVALENVLRIKPNLTLSGFSISFDNEELHKLDGIGSLIKFANVLNCLSRRAEDSYRAEAISSTTQMIAHDIKRPFNLLNMVLTTIELSSDANETKQIAAKALPRLHFVTNHVSGLLNDIIDIGIDLHLNLQTIDANTLISTSLSFFEGYKNTGVRTKSKTNSTRKILGDFIKLQRVVINILDNAYQALQNEGEIWIEVNEIKFGEYLEVCIGNSSIINGEDLDKIFDRFFTSGKSNGKGLGLAIAKKIIEAHGGYIKCLSSESLGTEFRFSVPVAKET